MSRAALHGWPQDVIPARMDERGRPVVPLETSADAASMTRTSQVLPSPLVSPTPAWTGAAPFNLTGAGTRIGHWEVNAGARTSHQEFANAVAFPASEIKIHLPQANTAMPPSASSSDGVPSLLPGAWRPELWLMFMTLLTPLMK